MSLRTILLVLAAVVIGWYVIGDDTFFDWSPIRHLSLGFLLWVVADLAGGWVIPTRQG